MTGKKDNKKHLIQSRTLGICIFLSLIFSHLSVPSSNVGSFSKQPTKIEIRGPDTVEENSIAAYEAVHIFPSQTESITKQVQWTVESCSSTIDSGGQLNTVEVDADKAVIIKSTLGIGREAQTATKVVTILDKGQTANYSHAGFFTTYEGSKTCNGCHLDKAIELHASVHYQWKGSTPYVVDMTTGGKLGNINDFCTYPDINFIGILTNLDGQEVDGGCATCHVGLGDKPEANPTISQLENMDCLI